jgi:hypothetical protein
MAFEKDTVFEGSRSDTKGIEKRAGKTNFSGKPTAGWVDSVKRGSANGEAS